MSICDRIDKHNFVKTTVLASAEAALNKLRRRSPPSKEAASNEEASNVHQINPVDQLQGPLVTTFWSNLTDSKDVFSYIV